MLTATVQYTEQFSYYMQHGFWSFILTQPSKLNLVCLCSFGFAEMPIIVGFLLFNDLVFTPLNPVLTLLSSAISRRYEFQADAFACALGKASDLQTGLVKVSHHMH